MANKFVRGITHIKTINNQDFDTNNVNDLLSDGHHNYIHRKKGTTEEYHNLTNNLKTLSSDDTDLLEVTNDNETINSATLHPKHDTRKEQLLESTDSTILISHGENGTDETTTVDVNFEKIQKKLTAGEGLSLLNNRIEIKPTPSNGNPTDNGFFRGNVIGDQQASLLMSLQSEQNKLVQLAFRESAVTPNLMVMRYRFVNNGVPTDWKIASIDNDHFLTLLSQKQNTLTNNTSIGVAGTGLRQLYTLKQTYSATNGVLKTHVKSVSENTSVTTAEEEFNFVVKINKGVSSVNFTLNSHDTTKFANIMSEYGENNTVRISGCVFTLSGSTLTVSTVNNTEQNYVITFSDII